MIKRMLLGGLCFGACWMAMINGNNADEGVRPQEEIEKEGIAEIAKKQSYNASYDLKKGGDLQTLTPTQAVGRLLPADAALRVRWALPIKNTTIRRLYIPPYAVSGMGKNEQESTRGYKFFVVETEEHDIIAVRGDTGVPVWWVKAPEEIFGEVCFGQENVHFICGNRLIAIERMSGQVSWNVALPFAPAAGPTVFDITKDRESTKAGKDGADPEAHVFLSSMNRQLYSLDVVKEIWPPERLRQRTNSKFAVELFILRTRWQYPLAGVSNHAPVYNDDYCYVYASCGAPYFYGITLSEGSVGGKPDKNKSFQYKMMGKGGAAPAYDQNSVFCPSLDHYLYCMDCRGDKQVWRYMASEPLYSTPQFIMDQETERCVGVVQRVGDSKMLVWLDYFSGKPLWQHDHGKMIVGVTVDVPRVKPELLTITWDTDGFLRSLACTAPDKRTPEQIKNDDLNQRHRTAEVVWSVDAKGFTNFMPNNYGNYIFCTTADRKMVCVLEKSH